MSIILLEDGITLGGMNKDAMLGEVLQRRGHRVTLFDGRDGRGRRLLDPTRAASIVYERILAGEAYGAVLDLQWFEMMDYGERMWAEIARFGLPNNFKLVIYSQLIGSDNRKMYAGRFRILPAQVFPRNNTGIDKIADQFNPFLIKRSKAKKK